VDRIDAIQVHVAIDHQQFSLLAFELRIAPLEVVARPMRLEFMGVEPYRGLARAGQSLEARALRAG
jgi:hypothetical protein